MAQSNVFLLLPETTPSNQWMLSNTDFQTNNGFAELIKDLIICFDSIKTENYSGYYDLNNIKNFIEHYSVLKEYYPLAPIRRLRSLLMNWANWRLNINQSNSKTYYLFNQPINNHSFCEIAERKLTIINDRFVLLNHSASVIKRTISISVNQRLLIGIENVSDEPQLKLWFSRNRIPKRNFHAIPKHGVNGRGNFQNANPLMCSEQRAKELIHTAIGESKNELFNYDSNHDMILVFKFENDNPQNLYHGYHINSNSTEVPNHILKKLLPNN